MKVSSLMYLTAIGGLLLLAGCAKKQSASSMYSSSAYHQYGADGARYPLNYSSMPDRSHEASTPAQGVSGFPEGHPLAPTTMPNDNQSVHTQSPSAGLPTGNEANDAAHF